LVDLAFGSGLGVVVGLGVVDEYGRAKGGFVVSEPADKHLAVEALFLEMHLANGQGLTAKEAI